MGNGGIYICLADFKKYLYDIYRSTADTPPKIEVFQHLVNALKSYEKEVAGKLRSVGLFKRRPKLTLIPGGKAKKSHPFKLL